MRPAGPPLSWRACIRPSGLNRLPGSGCGTFHRTVTGGRRNAGPWPRPRGREGHGEWAGLASYAFALTAFGHRARSALRGRSLSAARLSVPDVLSRRHRHGLSRGTLARILVGVLSFFSAWYFFLPPTGSFDLNLQTAWRSDSSRPSSPSFMSSSRASWRSQKSCGNERMRSAELAEQRDTSFASCSIASATTCRRFPALLSIQARSLADPQARASLQEADHPDLDGCRHPADVQ